MAHSPLFVLGRTAPLAWSCKKGGSAERGRIPDTKPSTTTRVETSDCTSHRSLSPSPTSHSTTSVNHGPSSDAEGGHERLDATYSSPPSEMESFDLDFNQISLADLAQGVHKYNAFAQIQQARATLASRSNFLREKLEAELRLRTERLAPHSYGWVERPWQAPEPAGGSVPWIGEHLSPSLISPCNRGRSLSGDGLCSQLRHADAREFPLENAVVENQVFSGILTSLSAHDRPGSSDWPHCNNGSTPSLYYHGATDGTNALTALSEYPSRCPTPQPRCRSVADFRSVYCVESNEDDIYNALPVRGTPTIAAQSARVASLTRPKTIPRLRLEAELEAKKAREMAELERKFRATPVPASSLLPRYAQIMRRMGTRSADTRRNRAKQLLSEAKPFSFCCGGDKNSAARALCRCNSQQTKAVQEALDQVDEKAREQRRKLQAKLLHKASSSLIASAAEEGRRRREKLEKNSRKIGITKEHVFRPTINTSIPDYKRKQAQFADTLKRRMEKKNPTTPMPFTGVSLHEEMARERKASRTQSTISGSTNNKHYNKTHSKLSLSDGLDVNVKHTRSSLLKAEFRNSALKQQAEKAQFEESARRADQREKEEAARIVREKLRAVSTQPVTPRQLKKDDSHVLDYKQQIREMKGRLRERLCLFERVAIENAKRKAETEIDKILQKI